MYLTVSSAIGKLTFEKIFATNFSSLAYDVMSSQLILHGGLGTKPYC